MALQAEPAGCATSYDVAEMRAATDALGDELFALTVRLREVRPNASNASMLFTAASDASSELSGLSALRPGVSPSRADLERLQKQFEAVEKSLDRLAVSVTSLELPGPPPANPDLEGKWSERV